MKTIKATARELRHYLFDNDVDIVINDVAYTNKDARRYLFDMINQDEIVEYKLIKKTKI